ncbi:hypothetical protein GN958_ATG12896, partial [Phytophthora infestans]
VIGCDALYTTPTNDQYELVNDRKSNARPGTGADVGAARRVAWTCDDGRVRWPLAAKETKDSRVEPGEQSLACIVEAAGPAVARIRRSTRTLRAFTFESAARDTTEANEPRVTKTNKGLGSPEDACSVDSEPRHRTNDSIGGRIEAGERADEWTTATDRVCVMVATAK